MLIATLAMSCASVVRADFFEINRIKYHDTLTKDGVGVWSIIKPADKDQKIRRKNAVFVPCLEVRVEVEKQTNTAGLIAKAYFFRDDEEKPEVVLFEPSKSGVKDKPKSRFRLPLIMEPEVEYRVFFAIPQALRETFGEYSVLLVFGDRHEIAAKSYPSSSYPPERYTFAEKAIYENPPEVFVDRKEAMNPLTELVVKTRNPNHPQITIFVRPPKGMTDGSQARGMLAWCVLAHQVDGIRRMLQGLDDQSELSGLTTFADKHQFALMAWGSRSIWNPGKNYDEYTKEDFEQLDKSFSLVADAWEDGVQKLHRKYGLPNHNFFLVGQSGAAQWAHRLALRKPEYFHAVQVHIPSSFDKPTPAASRILWCLTTGELESGYERSKRFFMDCRKLDYPIIYKAYMGVGHSGTAASRNMRQKFLEYAAGLIEERQTYEALLADTFGQDRIPDGPWPACYRNPEYVGDIVNQDLFPVADKDMVPPGFRVPLADKRLADAWERQK